MTTITKDMLERDGVRMEVDAAGRAATLYVYGIIGHDEWWDDVVSTSIVRQLDALEADTITVRINSPGGFARDGVAIMGALARHPAKVTAIVDGLAASAATIIAMGADEVLMGTGTEFMIHDAWSVVAGPSAKLAHEADHLDKLSASIAAIYAERAGGTVEEWRAAMLAETWYSAAETVEAGFAARVIPLGGDEDEPTSEAANVVPIDRAKNALGWQHAGRADAEAPFIPGGATRRAPAAAIRPGAMPAAAAVLDRPHPAGTANHEQKGDPTMSDSFNQGVRERLGLPADATEDQALNALEEQLTAPAAASAPPAGTVLIEESQLNALREGAEAGRTALAEQARSSRESAVNTAIDEGRIAPARREHWLKALEADPAAVETLNSLEKGLVPLEAKGHTGGVAEASDDDAQLYSTAWGTPTNTEEV